jgi:hypothetical protein
MNLVTIFLKVMAFLAFFTSALFAGRWFFHIIRLFIKTGEFQIYITGSTFVLFSIFNLVNIVLLHSINRGALINIVFRFNVVLFFIFVLLVLTDIIGISWM